MDSNLGGQAILQYGNQWGYIGVNTFLQETFQPQQLIALVLSLCSVIVAINSLIFGFVHEK